MTAAEALEQLLRSYGDYYDVSREAAPFAAEAVFHSHEAQYFLVRAARIAEAESHEYVFFALESLLEADRLNALAEAAWEGGLSRVRPHRDHRSSDVALIVLADRIAPEAAALVPKLRRYQSYRWGFQGWSHFRLCAAEVSTGRCLANRQGRRIRDLVRDNLAKRSD